LKNQLLTKLTRKTKKNVILGIILLTVITTAATAVTAITPPLKMDTQTFIQEMAKKYQFNPQYLEAIFSQIIIHPIPIITKKSTAPPAKPKPWYLYRDSLLTPTRINNGIKFRQQHAKALQTIQAKYDVPANILVAILGIESNYGHNSGTYPVLSTLANYAFSVHYYRAAFFRKELIEFLLLCREQHINPLTVKGSYAGAIGPGQFMPSSYRYYGINFTSNGKKGKKSKKANLISNPLDSAASIANYLHKLGWKKNEIIATQVYAHQGKLPTTSFKLKYTTKQLSVFSIKTKHRLPPHAKFRFITLENKNSTEYWLGSYNFYLITRYNQSTYYAMAVYQLSQAIALARENKRWGAGKPAAHPTE